MQMDLLIYHITLFFSQPNENTHFTVICKKCKNIFALRSGLRRHMTSKHQNALTTYSIKCKGGCTYTCRYISNLRDHLNINSMLGWYTIIHMQIRILNIPSGDQN